MIRKLRLQVKTDVANELIRFSDLDNRVIWPRAWNSLLHSAQELAQPLENAYEEAFGWAFQLSEWGLAELLWLEDPAKNKPLTSFEVNIDMVELLEWEEGAEACLALLRMLEAVESLEDGCDVQLWLGGRCSTRENVLEVFLEQAEISGYEIEFEVELLEEDEDLEEESERHQSQSKDYANGTSGGKANGYANGASSGRSNGYANGASGGKANGYTNGRSNGYANGAANEKSRGEKNGAFGDKEQRRRTFSWGNLDDDEFDPSGKKKKDPDALSNAAQFFLSYTTLPWPCSKPALKKAWQKALHNTHPDKYRNDPTAIDRTRLINQGYEELCDVISLAN